MYPTKQRPDQKIDAAAAVILALGRAIVEDGEANRLEGFLDNAILGQPVCESTCNEARGPYSGKRQRCDDT